MADPFDWLVDMLTSAWGEPKVAPPDAPEGRRVYRSETDGLVWIRLHDRSRRAWVWFPGGQNCNLAVDKGAAYVVRMGGGVAGVSRRIEITTQDLTWAGLTRETVEPAARWVYGIKEH